MGDNVQHDGSLVHQADADARYLRVQNIGQHAARLLQRFLGVFARVGLHVNDNCARFVTCEPRNRVRFILILVHGCNVRVGWRDISTWYGASKCR